MQSTVLFDEVTPQSVHCASITETSPNQLLAVAYTFSYETSPDSRIVLTRYDGKTWSDVTTLVDLPGIAVGNPVIYTAEDGRVHLFYVALFGETWTESRLIHSVSHDSGNTWNPHSVIHNRPGLMTKTRPLEVNGEMLLPIYDEKMWCSHVLKASAPYEYWTLYGDTTARGKTIQPAIAPLDDGRLLMLSRSPSGKIYRSLSYNNGHTWTASQPTNLPNPNSGIELLKLSTGALLLIFNPDEIGRNRIAHSTSMDSGQSWSTPHVLEFVDGELSYPYAIEAHDGSVHLLYTRQRTEIVHHRLVPDAFTAPTAHDTKG